MSQPSTFAPSLANICAAIRPIRPPVPEISTTLSLNSAIAVPRIATVHALAGLQGSRRAGYGASKLSKLA